MALFNSPIVGRNPAFPRANAVRGKVLREFHGA
jgi:hypothetical protein